MPNEFEEEDSGRLQCGEYCCTAAAPTKLNGMRGQLRASAEQCKFCDAAVFVGACRRLHADILVPICLELDSDLQSLWELCGPGPPPHSSHSQPPEWRLWASGQWGQPWPPSSEGSLGAHQVN